MTALSFRRKYFVFVLLQEMSLELELTPVPPAGDRCELDQGKQSVSCASAGKEQMKEKKKKKKCKFSTRAKEHPYSQDQAPVSALAEHKMKLVLLEIRNAKLAKEKLKLEILVHKTRLEYYRKRNASHEITDRMD
jgi:hypothetical protein